MNSLSKRKVISFLFTNVLVFGTLLPVPVLAVSNNNSTNIEIKTESQQETNGGTNTRKQEFRVNVQNAASERLKDARLSACQKHEARVNTIIDKSVIRQKRLLNVFSEIQSKVEAFYSRKQLSVSNYDTLVAAANEKKAAAETTINTLDSTDFHCADESSTNPGGVVRTNLEASHTALKDYRQAIRELIKAVKGANEAKTGTEDESTT